MVLTDLKNCILSRFAYKRDYASVKDLLDDINSHMADYMPQMTFPFVVGGYTFDAKYPTGYGDIAVSVVLKHGKSYGKDEVGYILHQMEQAEKNDSSLRGGVVIYNTDNIDEWENICIALERPTIYNAEKYDLDAIYCENWEEPKEGEKVARRYAIFMTAKAQELA